jgi:hypothetical protein
MKSWLLKGVVAAAIALPALSGTARAGGTNDHFVCSNATLRGDYAFSVLTVTAPPGVVVGLGTFDGKGGFSQIDYPGDSGLASFRTGQTGTYLVGSNCTGFMTINLGGGAVVENAIVISNGGRSIHAVVADFKLGSTDVPGQTRVDFWKVAPEQDD